MSELDKPNQGIIIVEFDILRGDVGMFCFYNEPNYQSFRPICGQKNKKLYPNQRRVDLRIKYA